MSVDNRVNTMSKKRKIAKEKNRTFNWKMKYEINGYRYTFEKIYLDEKGIPYGYCSKNKSWAWLLNDAISRYGMDIDLIPATRLDSKVYYSDGTVVSAWVNKDGEVEDAR